MIGSTCLVGRNVPRRFTAITWSKSSALISHTGVSIGPVTPAALTRMSMRPNVSRARATSRSTAGSSVTSVGTAIALRPIALISTPSASSGPTSRAAIVRFAPSRASVRQISRPMPFAAPVTTAIRSASFMKRLPPRGHAPEARPTARPEDRSRRRHTSRSRRGRWRPGAPSPCRGSRARAALDSR